jgi:hypothetical protein
MAIFRKINCSKSANFGAFFHEIPLYKLHWIFWGCQMMKICPQKNASCIYTCMTITHWFNAMDVDRSLEKKPTCNIPW